MFNCFKERDFEAEITPWDQTPVHKAKSNWKTLKKSDFESMRPISKPYRPRTIQCKRPIPKENAISVQNVTFSIPPMNKAFPKRLFKSPERLLKRNFMRSNSCVTDNLSIFDIEHIERVQRLIPYRIPVTSDAKYCTNRHNSKFQGQNNSILAVGIVKMSGTADFHYRKYIKQS